MLILVIDSYLPVAGEALLLINGLKTVTFGFGFSYGVPWVTQSGFQRAFGTMVGINCGIIVAWIAALVLGKAN
jgi:hypothetical protein